MGIYEQPAASLLDALDAEFDIVAPRDHGHDTVAAIGAMARGDVDVFIGMGGNFVAAAPDTNVTAAPPRAAATAALAPLPPGLMRTASPRTVSPRTGSRATGTVRSTLVEPTTKTRPANTRTG